MIGCRVWSGANDDAWCRPQRASVFARAIADWTHQNLDRFGALEYHRRSLPGEQPIAAMLLAAECMIGSPSLSCKIRLRGRRLRRLPTPLEDSLGLCDLAHTSGPGPYS